MFTLLLPILHPCYSLQNSIPNNFVCVQPDLTSIIGSALAIDFENFQKNQQLKKQLEQQNNIANENKQPNVGSSQNQIKHKTDKNVLQKPDLQNLEQYKPIDQKCNLLQESAILTRSQKAVQASSQIQYNQPIIYTVECPKLGLSRQELLKKYEGLMMRQVKNYDFGQQTQNKRGKKNRII